MLFEELEDIPKEFHYDSFEVRDGRLNYVDKDDPITKKDGDSRTIKQIKMILGVERLYNLGFESSKRKVTF